MKYFFFQTRADIGCFMQGKKKWKTFLNQHGGEKLEAQTKTLHM